MLINRRGILVGQGSLLAAPAIVRASSLMPVKAFVEGPFDGAEITFDCDAASGLWQIVSTSFSNGQLTVEAEDKDCQATCLWTMNYAPYKIGDKILIR